MFSPLILDPAPTSLWLAFQAEPRALEGRGGVLTHWRRSHALGAPCEGPKPEDALERGAALRDRTDQLEPLLRCGRGVLERVAAIADEHDYTLLVSDADGVVVHAAGGGEFARDARRVRLIEGAHWSEGTRGTNAIGTAIAERRPVFVRGGAHYARSYHDLVCYAAPVRGPDGRVVAVLDATSTMARDDGSMGFGIVAAAHALEEVLRARSYGRAGSQVTRTIARTLDHVHDPALLIEPPGRIARCNRAARELLGAGGVRGGLRRALGLDFAQLVAMASAEPLDLQLSGGANVRVRVEPIESDGEWIAALVLLQQRAPRATFASPANRTIPASAAPAAFDGLFTEDASVQRAVDLAMRVAPSELPIMLLAETGAGKELVAQGIHRASGREDEPFVAVNCGSIQPSLLESELFGYGPGAFTGAERGGREGYLAAAGGGTLFLDEVAEMPLAMQAALLRVLETHTYRRVGETQLQTARCRIVCATCRDLPALVERGAFRRDLYFRLKGAAVTLPPLRDRSDVVPLARHMLAQLAAARGLANAPELSPTVEQAFARAAWPGNVRELKTTLEVALVLADGAARIEPQHLPDDLPAAHVGAEPATSGAEALEDVEARAVRKALAAAGGNVSRAAEKLGVARSTLYRMMRRHGV